MMVVSLKYVVLIMRADNRGEGGIMALLALASTAVKDHPQWRAPLMLIGVFGASLFYGDAVLTPAISVLSAVEGLEVGTSAFKPYVVPIAVVVIVALFAFQARGTAVVGRLFGPVTLALVPRARRRRPARHRAVPGRAGGAQSGARRRLSSPSHVVGIVRRARRRWCWR